MLDAGSGAAYARGVKFSFRYFFWGLAGAVVFVAVILVVLHFQPTSVAAQVEARARREEVVNQLQFHLASATEAEKSAVLATTDKDSEVFADQARAETATVEGLRADFGTLAQTGREKQLLADFSKAFTEYQQIDAQLLDLAVKNTNLKAYALAFGPAAAAIDDMDAALSRLIAQGEGSAAANARQVMFLAAGAEAAARRIQVLLPPHIAEESDSKMDELEARMTAEDQRVANDMKGLAALLPSNQNVETASSRYATFSDLRRQIIALSRANTNVRSLTISLNQKRAVTALCQDALLALEKTIEEESIPGENVVNPR